MVHGDDSTIVVASLCVLRCWLEHLDPCNVRQILKRKRDTRLHMPHRRTLSPVSGRFFHDLQVTLLVRYAGLAQALAAANSVQHRRMQ